MTAEGNCSVKNTMQFTGGGSNSRNSVQTAQNSFQHLTWKAPISTGKGLSIPPFGRSWRAQTGRTGPGGSRRVSLYQ